MTDELFVPAPLRLRLLHDLTSIRAASPEMVQIRASPTFDHHMLLVRLTEEAWAQWEAGTYTGLDDFFDQYGPFEVLWESSRIELFVLGYEQDYNPRRLAEICEQSEGVEYAEPNHIYGAAGHGIELLSDPFGDDRLWKFHVGWGDCPAGCIYEHRWQFGVGDAVTFLGEEGDPLETPLLSTVVASPGGGILDGEFTGQFPSGDGFEGGDFEMILSSLIAGDCSLDHCLGAEDMVRLLNHLDGTDPLTGEWEIRGADLTGEGEITAEDLMALRDALLGVAPSP
jgi:hypothetical protein